MKIYLVLYKSLDGYLPSFEHIVAPDMAAARQFADKHQGVAYWVHAAGGIGTDFNIPTFKLVIGQKI